MSGFGERSHEVVSFSDFQRRQNERQMRVDVSHLIDMYFFIPKNVVAPWMDAMFGLKYVPPETVVPLFRARKDEKR